MRNNIFLENRLNQIWNLLFQEVPRQNKITIIFKGKWKNKFGHIKKLKDNSTEIAINSLFKNETIPEYILDLTIAHELIHYMHGFNSPLPKLFRYPHKGNIVNKELKKRGFEHLLKKEKQWVKNSWPYIYKIIT